MSASEAPTTVLQGRYELRERIGRGGMGVVWAATDTLLQRRVAVKQVTLPSGVAPEEVELIRARVLREARAAGRLSHPNVITVFDVVNEDGQAWIVMEHVDGATLTEIVDRGGPLEPAEAAALGAALLDALQAAHRHGIVHRDVKPGNVMVPADGGVKLADFGVAAVQGDPKITATGLIVGSPSYMAPEQAREGTSTEATDLWGLGATLYFAVEGKPPFDRGGAIPTLTAVSHDPPAPMHRAGPLAPLLNRLLEKEPSDRPTTDEVASVLQSLATAAPGGRDRTLVDPRPPEPAPAAADDADPQADAGWGTAAAPRGRRVWPVLVTVAALLVGAVWLASNGLTERPTDDQAAQEAGQEQAAEQEQSAQADDDAPAEQSPGEQPTEDSADDQDAATPPEWETHAVGDTGTTVAYPAGWEPVQRDAVTTDLVDPEGGRYLRVQFTDQPRDDAVADWQQQSQSFDARHDDYEEIRIERVDLGDDAALWEYTYTDGGAELHAYNLAIVTGGRGYALNFQTHESRWEESQPVWEQIVASFDPS
ncbi:MAG TPA: serine/threonine-protein kinase [Egibacteraceae bacterium]|nr:serine/threonine-protein kinase [Egibacteraceae bacterium]